MSSSFCVVAFLEIVGATLAVARFSRAWRATARVAPTVSLPC